MIPFQKEYIIEKINEYNNMVSEGKCGNYKIIKKKSLANNESYYLYDKKEGLDIDIPELVYKDQSIMKINPRELQGSYESIKLARGKVGVVGLGLGYVVQEIAKKANVTEVIVYEISKEIIELYNKNFKTNKKIKIILGDAYKAKKENFDYFYVDLYRYDLTNRVVEDYVKFNNIHEIKEYTFWGVEHFLLSCRYEEIIWVYVPENWMVMSKEISSSLTDSEEIKYYKQLDEKLVSNILKEFKKILNDDEAE